MLYTNASQCKGKRNSFIFYTILFNTNKYLVSYKCVQVCVYITHVFFIKLVFNNNIFLMIWKKLSI